LQVAATADVPAVRGRTCATLFPQFTLHLKLHPGFFVSAF